MDQENGEDKKKKKRAKLDVEDLATRLIKTSASEDYVEVCIKNVFERIRYESQNVVGLTIAEADTSISLPSTLASNLKQMGITQLLPTQRYTLPLLADHDTDVFVGASTGHGKTLAFLIPIAVNLLRQPRPSTRSGRPRALIISNTQILQVQTYTVCKSLLSGTGLRAVLVCGETSVPEQRKEINREGVDIVIATTGRLNHFINLGVLSLDDLQYFIYDEADKMTQQGAFQDPVRDITDKIPPETKVNLRTCFFTATLDAVSSFENMYREDKYSIVRVPGNPLITHHIIPLDVHMDNDDQKSLILMQLLVKDMQTQGRDLHDGKKDPYTEKTVVFVGTKWKCNYLNAYIRMYGFSAGVVNSDLSLDMRNKILQRFSNGEIQALICTDSMARGHDIPNVKHVINYDVSDLDTFKHRAGRTARIGHRGVCTTLLSRPNFFLYPQFSDDPRRQKAVDFANYLALECGQRVPNCLVDSVYEAMNQELERWGQPEPDARRMIQELVNEKMEAEKKEIEEELNRLYEEKQRKDRMRREEKIRAKKEKYSSTDIHTMNEEEEEKQMSVQQALPRMAILDDDGTPVFDASMTNRSVDYTDDEDEEDEDDDYGGVGVDDSDYDDNDYVYGADYPADSDSDGPKADDTVEEEKQIMRWTDDEDEEEDINKDNDDIDEEIEKGRLRAMVADYERQNGEKKEEEEDEDEDDDVTLTDSDEESIEVEVFEKPIVKQIVVNDDEVD